MTKNLFQPGEIKKKDGEFKLGLVHNFYHEVEEVKEDEIPEYTGPTIEDIKKEVEEYKAKWEIEKAKMIEDAQKEAETIVENAKETAFEQIKSAKDEAQEIKAAAQSEGQKIVDEANESSKKIKEEAQSEVEQLKSSVYEQARSKGEEDGFASGKSEVERLIERVHTILETVMARREEILSDTEGQIVDLVLLISRKVVKIMSENQKQVVMANVLQALKKVKSRGNVTVRVNMDDLKITTENISNFIKQVESIKGITFVEDGTVEKGGCIVETDFGEVDARISSQLGELEAKILEISPLKTVSKQKSENN